MLKISAQVQNAASTRRKDGSVEKNRSEMRPAQGGKKAVKSQINLKCDQRKNGRATAKNWISLKCDQRKEKRGQQ